MEHLGWLLLNNTTISHLGSGFVFLCVLPYRGKKMFSL